MHVCFRVHVRPLASRYRNLRHRLTRAVFAILVHIPSGGHRIVDGRSDEPVRYLVLRPGVRRVGSGPISCAPSGLSVSHEHRLAIARVNGREGVSDMDYERGAADGRRVGESGLNSKILAEVYRRCARSHQAVDVFYGQSGVFQRVVRRFGVVLKVGLVLNSSYLVGLGHTNNGRRLGQVGHERPTS